jgi:HipA-like protein
MINKLINKIWKVDGMDYSDTPTNSKGIFNLYFGDQLIGILTYDNSIWTFRYSDEYIANQNLKPIIDFPDPEKTYHSEQLWPFFATRIPTLNQPFQLKKVRKAKIKANDSVGLLRLFGNETITNPFKLYPA